MRGWLKGALWGLGIGIIVAIINYFIGDYPYYPDLGILPYLAFLWIPIAIIVLGAFIGSWVDFFKNKSKDST